MLTVCSFAEFGGKVQPLSDSMRSKAQRFVKEMNAQGMRVLALAQKSFLSKENNFAIEDEKEMVLIGYLAFLDPPKESASQAIKQLHEHGVEVKVLSGDNEAVVKAISRQVGINTSDSVTAGTRKHESGGETESGGKMQHLPEAYTDAEVGNHPAPAEEEQHRGLPGRRNQ